MDLLYTFFYILFIYLYYCLLGNNWIQRTFRFFKFKCRAVRYQNVFVTAGGAFSIDNRAYFILDITYGVHSISMYVFSFLIQINKYISKIILVIDNVFKFYRYLHMKIRYFLNMYL